MKNIKNNSLKSASNKKIIIMVIVLILTLILGIIFISNINSDFVITKTIFGDMTSSIESTNPGAGEYLLLTLFVSGLTLVGELGLLIVILFLFLIVPVISSILFLLLSIIARLFQIGQEKKWKEITTKVIIYISISLEALLSIYIAILSFTGFDLLYIPIYLMLITHIVSLVINIINLVTTNKNKIMTK